MNITFYQLVLVYNWNSKEYFYLKLDIEMEKFVNVG